MKKVVITLLSAVVGGSTHAEVSANTAEEIRLYATLSFAAIVLLLAIIVCVVVLYVAKVLKVVIHNEANSRSETTELHQTFSTLTRLQWVTYTIVPMVVLATSSLFVKGTGIVVQSTGRTAVESKPTPVMTAAFVERKDEVTIEKGRTVFTTNCAACHRADGGGNPVGPNLTDEYWIHGGTADSVYQIIKAGVIMKGMPAWGKSLKPEDLNAVTNFVLNLQGSSPPDAKPPQGDKLLSSR